MAGLEEAPLDEIDQMLLDAADGIFEVAIKTEDFVKTDPRKPKYICADCGKACRSAKVLANHYLREHLEGDSTCEHCTTEQKCARHHIYYNWATRSNNARPHQCLSCSEAFATPAKFRSHQCDAQDGSRPKRQTKPKVPRKRTIVRVETTPVPESEQAHYGVPWPVPSHLPAPTPTLATQHDRMRIGFVLQNDRRRDIDVVLQD